MAWDIASCLELAMQPSPPDTATLTVLLIDDREDCITTLDLALERLPGVVLRSAATAEAAWEVLRRFPIAAVITDIQLPNMTGLELISRIRRDPGLARLPIVVVSADPDPATPGRALQLGANAFFSKPFSPGAIRKKLEELIYG
jgi:chemotaxis family two-component system sensor histidine kinase/response regulator PixL